jgi:GT2 family glycosyltransferase
VNQPQPLPFDENRPPFVTVLIVSFNGKKYLGPCLDSVLDQEFPRDHYEVMVIDNASRDGSADFVAQNYPSVRLVRNDENYGPNRALTRVGDLLHTKYVAYLNQDVVAHRRWLVELWQVIQTHPEAGVVESSMILPSWPEYQGMKREGLVERAYVCDVTLFGTHEFRTMPVTPTTPPVPVLAVYGAGTMSNLAILAQLDHVLDPTFFAYADDLDLGLRLNLIGYQVLLAPRSVVYHDTDWHFKWDMRSIRRSLWVTQNTILAFYKSCYWSEFLYLLPFLLVGKLRKARQDQRSMAIRLFYALMGTPLLLLGFGRALIHMPKLREKRRRTLAQRKMPRGWVVNRLYHANWSSSPDVWNMPQREAHETSNVSGTE